MKLIDIFKQPGRNGAGDPGQLGELARLARGCAREGYTTNVLVRGTCDKPECGCALCGEPIACPMRFNNTIDLVAMLVCERCAKRNEEDILKLAKSKLLASAVVLPVSSRLRVITGYKIEGGSIQ